MSARAAMLGRIRDAHAASGLSPLPHPGRFEPECAGDTVARFVSVAAAGGARLVTTSRADVGALARSLASPDAAIYSRVPEVHGTVPTDVAPHTLADVALCVLEGQVGVAESGAIWVSAPMAAPRAALFLAEHVLLVLRAEAVVDTMHDAYAAIDVTASPFGCFVAGPSKTADIEQALVVGAHGPMGLTVALVR